MAERLQDILTVGGVPEGDANSVAQWKSAHLVIAIRPLDRIGFEYLLFAFRHHDAIAAVEFCPDNPRRNLPKQPPDDVFPPHLEYFLGGMIEGHEPPIRVEGEKSFSDSFQDFLD